MIQIINYYLVFFQKFFEYQSFKYKQVDKSIKKYLSYFQNLHMINKYNFSELRKKWDHYTMLMQVEAY